MHQPVPSRDLLPQWLSLVTVIFSFYFIVLSYSKSFRLNCFICCLWLITLQLGFCSLLKFRPIAAWLNIIDIYLFVDSSLMKFTLLFLEDDLYIPFDKSRADLVGIAWNIFFDIMYLFTQYACYIATLRNQAFLDVSGNISLISQVGIQLLIYMYAHISWTTVLCILILFIQSSLLFSYFDNGIYFIVLFSFDRFSCSWTKIW